MYNYNYYSLFHKIPVLGRVVEMLGLMRPDTWLVQQRVRQAQWAALNRKGVTQYNLAHIVPVELALEILDADALPPHLGYRYFVKRKRDGRRRELAAPNEALKKMQAALVNAFLKDPKLAHPAALGYRRKRSTADHAWTHAGAETVITCDIADFFPSTAAWRVEAWWRSQSFPHNKEPMPEPAARLLTLLTTDRGGLPQGAPTSPALSNVVNEEMDTALTRKANRSGGVYTRYVDDLVFSWPAGHAPESDFEGAVRAILRTYGYRLNAEKGWRVYGRGDEPEITGIVLRRDGKADIPVAMRETIRRLERDTAWDDTRLNGYYGYRDMVQKPRTRAVDLAAGQAELRFRAGRASRAKEAARAKVGDREREEHDRW